MNILEKAALLPEDKWTRYGEDHYLPELFNEVFGVPDYLSLEWEDQKKFPLDFVWVNTHICTDTQVGKKIYRYKGVMFAITEQEYRRDDENLFIINKKVLRECIADFRELCQDEDVNEIEDDHPVLKSCGYFNLKYSSEALTKNAYFLPEGAERDSDNLLACRITSYGLSVNSYCDGYRVKLVDTDEVLTVTSDRIFFKEFEGE